MFSPFLCFMVLLTVDRRGDPVLLIHMRTACENRSADCSSQVAELESVLLPLQKQTNRNFLAAGMKHFIILSCVGVCRKTL